MTNGEYFRPPVETQVQRSHELDTLVAHVKTHVDAVGHSQGAMRRDWRDYVSPLIARAYASGIDLSDEEASRYVKDYIDNPPKILRSDREDWSGDPDSPTFMDTVYDVAFQRLVTDPEEPASPPSNEPQGEHND